ncbi:MAG: DUF2953 domain-containing protein [Methanosarcina flavescens]|jgi:hypothetical protein|uniref:DUF2953 domain-containing protein n=1 Tax=Methanosarcina flavescens TaxID=1715806 RepID=A0A660HQY4_9EURY|nr:DUF2953 domain-containing protein [Methanosarcina flavescens]AYK14632.1 DUF2953 domain-containing protein [Methanosarcina flavescens]NLK32433.1 DUF2953 domain-containing protein [Methanosarcina flavescens]
MLAIYILLFVLLLILFILITAIGFTFKLNVLSLEEKKELRGIFTVKWLLFSHTFSVEEPGERESPLEEPEIPIEGAIITGEQGEAGPQEPERVRAVTETKDKVETGERRETEEKRLKEERVEVYEDKKEKIREDKCKRGIIARIRGKNEPEEEKAPQTGMTTREKLHWGFEAYKSLKKPMLRLFFDLFKGIKIKRLDSYMAFGLDDPADTGILCGFIHSIAGLVYNRCRHCSFSINPVFMNPIMDFRGSIEIRVRIYSLIFPMLRFMLNRKTLSFTYLIIKEKVWGRWKSNS